MKRNHEIFLEKKAFGLLTSILICSCIALAHSEDTNETLTSEGILGAIKASGAKAVVNKFYNTDSWDYILAKVATGNSDWLAVGKALRNGTDAGSTSMLRGAIGEALVLKPSLVLKLFAIEEACDGPDIDSPKFSTKKKAFKELERRIKAVNIIRDQKENRELCLKHLEGSRASIESFFKNEK